MLMKWPPFIFDGQSYSLDHLEDRIYHVEDSKKVQRKVLVVFSDHCFTRSRAPEDDETLWWSSTTREDGTFCFDRYTLSKSIVEHLEMAFDGESWIVDGENFAILPSVDHQGQRFFYGVFFSLEKAKSKGSKGLIMFIRSAYHFIEPPATYGCTRYRHLLTLRIEGKTPLKTHAANRKRPKLT